MYYITLWLYVLFSFFVFFFNDSPTTEIYTLSLHDALPICSNGVPMSSDWHTTTCRHACGAPSGPIPISTQAWRSEEHTSELQSRQYLVCRLLLEKKKK